MSNTKEAVANPLNSAVWVGLVGQPPLDLKQYHGLKSPLKGSSWVNPSPSRDNSQEELVRTDANAPRRTEGKALAANILSLAYVGDRKASVGVLDSLTGKVQPVLNGTIPVGGSLDLPPVNGARAWNLDGRVAYFVGSTEQGTYLYSFDLEKGQLQVSSGALELLPWTLAYDPRYPEHLWCFAVKPFVYSPLALYQVEIATGSMRLVKAFGGKYTKVIRGGQDNYSGAYDPATSRFFIFLEKGQGKALEDDDEYSHSDEDEQGFYRNYHGKQKEDPQLAKELKAYQKKKKRERRGTDPLLLVVDTDRLQIREIPIQFSRLPMKLNTLESFVYSKRWNCLFGFASMTRGKYMFPQRMRMQFVRINVGTGEVIPLGKEWESYKRAEDGLITLDEERGLLFTSIVSEWSWFTTHWRYVTINVRTGEVAHETTWYSISSRTICFFPTDLVPAPSPSASSSASPASANVK